VITSPRLDAGDAAELAELLGFLADWLDGGDRPQLAASLHRFIGTSGYDLDGLRADLARFAFLLGTNGGAERSDL
jgi:hypothetical protein